MILRKPYAFLIKYFQRINLLLLLLVCFVFYKNVQLYQFAKDYVNTGVYNTIIDPITNYTNGYVYLAFILILVISVILAYLLRYKDKPYASYIVIFVVNVITLGFFIYTHNYFEYTAVKGFLLVASKVVKDLLFISLLPYFPLIFILLIRSIGIDLKSFGFHEDKEFVEINEEDREEVEVEVGFDRDRWVRRIKYSIRHFKYFFLEHKIILISLFCVLVAVFGFIFYNNVYVKNRIYSMNEALRSNNYRITVNNTYLTDKDYTGNIVSEEGRYFILVDLKIQNLLNISRNFDIEKVLLFIDNDYYVPTTRFNSYFTDMGNLYDGGSIDPNDTTSYVLVYEINKPSSKANFLLKYQDLNSRDSKLIRVKIKVLDISTFKTKGNYNFKQEAVVPINENETAKFKLNTFEFLESVDYRYQQCEPYSCPIYEKTVNAPKGYKILYLKGDYGVYSTKEFNSFLKKYGKLYYKKDGKYIQRKISFAVNRDYQGKHIYLLVPDEVANSEDLSLLFTIRTYQYFYKIKGE